MTTLIQNNDSLFLVKKRKSSNYYSNLSTTFLNFVLFFTPLLLLSSMAVSIIEFVNPVLVAIITLFIIFYYAFRENTIRDLAMIGYIVISTIVNGVICKFTFYNNNLIFYFPFFLIYFNTFINEKNYIISFYSHKKTMLDCVLILWSLIIMASIIFNSSYRYEGETFCFVSIVGTTFRLSPIAIFAFSLSFFQFVLYRRFRYLFPMFLSSFCILFGASRTYVGVLVLCWLVFLFTYLKNKRNFFIILIPFLIVLLMTIFVSPSFNKFLLVTERTSQYGNEVTSFWYNITSGRSVFWQIDITHIFDQPLPNVLFGNGTNFIYYINEKFYVRALWAHNDFIEILGELGFLGLIIYIHSILRFCFSIKLKKKVFIVPIFLIICLWFVNAFFNMFYTYFCSMLSLPFFFFAVQIDMNTEQKRKGIHFKSQSKL